ncbi:uncharacterized protein [Typha latifolia]|uniref:uncharacterized protein n=1 Tax=Typha latifolia TaxID=4733 RepID=UPI003C2DAF1E
MNSSYSGNRPQRTATSSSAAAAASYDSYQFDFGLGSNRNSSSSRPLRDQKPSLGTAPTPSTKPSVPWTHQPSKPSWTHQPVAGAAAGSGSAGSASMVGDIFGKSWGSAAPAASSSRLGIPESNPNLFGDLLGSALGSGRSASNVPLKAAAPASKNSFSMGKLSDSLPKSTASGIGSNAAMGTTWGSADSVGKVSSFGQGTGMIGNPMASGGQPMKSASGMAGSTPMNSKKDPFGSLMDFGSKPATKAPSVSSNSAKSSSSGGADSTFGSFHNANSTKINDFGMPSQSFTSRQPSQQPDPVKSGVDPLDMLFSSTTTPAPAPANAKGVSESEMFSEMNDWDTGAEFGGHDDGGTTTELEGLPPPPAGVTVSAAKTKGMDNYKQGQFADAIKWLSWAVVLLGKSGDNAATTEVLSCRASSYKEVGEYKKAIADCSKVLEYDKENVSVLLQRALLYESTEKYRLGADDLRMVLKFDPGNRLARSTIHRLNKLAD